MTASDLVLWFSEIGDGDAPLVGGKAHSLAALTAAGFTDQRGGGTAGLWVGVVVRRRIPADVAGVLFTVNPLTGREHESLIESCFGLGEALVSGRVNADSFVVDPTNGQVAKRSIAVK